MANEHLGIFQGDLIIKTAIELGLYDIRQNSWIIDDIFRSLRENPYLLSKYGEKEIARAKEFLLNNDIPIYLAHRLDKQEFPCITISLGESSQDLNRSMLGDVSPNTQTYKPNEINKTLSWIIPPFVPESYDAASGWIYLPDNLTNVEYLTVGMLVVDPANGNAWIISEIGDGRIKIDPNIVIPQKIAIAPQYQLYTARREWALFREQYIIGCHVHGDPAPLIYLHSLVKYLLLRYKEGLLEYSGFEISSVKSSDLIKNDAFIAENVYSRWITLDGIVYDSWVKTPMRTLESAIINDSGLNASGIKILSNLDEVNPDPTKNIWTTIDENKTQS